MALPAVARLFYSELHPLEWLRRDGGAALPAPPLRCEQRAGDVLFLPRLWGHGTLNVGEVDGVATPFSLRQGLEFGLGSTGTG